MTKMKVTYQGDLHTECIHEESGAIIQTDAPKDNQGRGEAFSPTDLFAVSLASCLVTLMGISAKKLNIDLKGTTVEVEKEMTGFGTRRIAKIVLRVRSPICPNSEDREKLEKAGQNCPVSHSLHPDIKLEIDFIWGL